MTSRGSETNTYDVANKPTKLGSSQFAYGPSGQKYKETNSNSIIWFLAGGQYEVVQQGATVTEKTYVGDYLHQKANNVVTHNYLLRDHLGSVDAISDAAGNITATMSFDAYGNRRQSTWLAGNPTNGMSNFFATNEGYTGHEMLDSLNLIHMGGRVYDPTVGRFLSADILVQAPFNSQSFNRYFYVVNNPLGRVDPTGYASQGSTTCDASSCYVNAPSTPYVWPDAGRENSNNGSVSFSQASFTPEVAAQFNFDVGSISNIEGNLLLGAAQVMIADVTMGMIFGETSSIELFHPGVQSLANMAAARNGPAGNLLMAASLASIGINPAKGGARLALNSVKKGPTLGAGATLEKLTGAEKTRIQNAANRSGLEIAVVGSRVNPNKPLRANSDYDYVINANNKVRSNLANSLPGSKDINSGISGNQDIFKGQVDQSRPYAIFHPQ